MKRIVRYIQMFFSSLKTADGELMMRMLMTALMNDHAAIFNFSSYYICF